MKQRIALIPFSNRTPKSIAKEAVSIYKQNVQKIKSPKRSRAYPKPQKTKSEGSVKIPKISNKSPQAVSKNAQNILKDKALATQTSVGARV